MTRLASVARLGPCHAIVVAVVILLAAAIAAASLTVAGVRVITVAAPYDALPATPATAVELLVHNAVVALWPLALVQLGWPAIRGARRVGDALVAAQLLGHGALIGTALAQHPELWRYLPHLPLESVALALPCAAWVSSRSGTGPSPRRLLAQITTVIGLLALAAVLETYAVPLP